MNNSTLKRAQAVWAGLGGLGPVPRVMVGWGDTESAWVEDLAGEAPAALEQARQQAEAARHRLRIDLIGRCLIGHSTTIDDDALAKAAVRRADAVLKVLEAEARGAR